MAQCKLLFVNVTRLVFAVSGQAGVDVDRAGVGAVRNVMAAGETHSHPTHAAQNMHITCWEEESGPGCLPAVALWWPASKTLCLIN